MINILFLPNSKPSKKLKLRILELAKELDKDDNFQVYYLNRAISLFDDLIYGLKQVFKKKDILVWEESNIRFVRVPYIPTIFNGLLFYNKKLIQKAITKLNIRVIINNFSHSIPMPVSSDLLYIYNFDEDYAAYHKNPLIKMLLNRFVKKEISKSDFLIAGARTLGERVREKKWRENYICLPPPINPDTFNIVSEEEITAIKRKYNLENRIIIGHIGHQDKKSGLDFLIKVFKNAHSLFPKLALFIVGPGKEAEKFSEIYKDNKDIVFTGPIEPAEISSYFFATDIGVLPYTKDPSVYSRFPIRLAEFIAARKVIISWPFGDLKLLNLPNVILVEREVDKWTEAILKAKDIQWNPEWDYVVEEFSIKNIITNLKSLIQIQAKKKGIKL